MSVGQCRTCNAPITWTEIHGKRMPLDAAPSPKGNVRLMPTPEVLGNGVAADARTAGEDLYLSHFVTCPQANSWRKSGIGTAKR